jgi:hypothetical protein
MGQLVHRYVLAAISAYVQVAESSGDFGLLSLLAAIREEVLAAVSGEMQPDIQVVQLVARLASKEDRLEVLRAAHRGGGSAAGFNIPGAPIEKVENTAARLVDEMELQEHVPNWQLLYQLLLVRETARQLHPNADDFGMYGTTILSSSFSPSVGAVQVNSVQVESSVTHRLKGDWFSTLEPMK